MPELNHFHTQLRQTLDTPTIHIHAWFKLFNHYLTLLHHDNADHQSYTMKCLELQASLCTLTPKTGQTYIIGGLTLTDWCQLMCHLVLNSPLPLMLGSTYCLTLMSFHSLFVQQTHSLSLGLLDHGASTLALMLSEILHHHLLNPCFNPAFSTWKTAWPTLKKRLDQHSSAQIYAFLFMPNHTNTIQRHTLMQNIAIWLNREYIRLDHPKTKRFHPIAIQSIKKHLIEPRQLLTYLMDQAEHTLADVITMLEPLPLEDIQKIGLSLSSAEQRQNWFTTIFGYCANLSQQEQIMMIYQFCQNHSLEPSIDMVTQCYCVDQCRIIHQKNLAYHAQRQKKIQYLITHPLTQHTLKTLLCHFNVRVKNLEHWLLETTIDKNDCPKNTCFEDLASITNGYPELDQLIIERFTTQKRVVAMQHHTLATHYQTCINHLLYTYSKPLKGWWNQWFKASIRCHKQMTLVADLKAMHQALLEETDFTFTMAQLRSYTEKNSCLCCSENITLFNEMKHLGHETAMLRHNSFANKYIR